MSEVLFVWTSGFLAFAIFLLIHILFFKFAVPTEKFKVLKNIFAGISIAGFIVVIFGPPAHGLPQLTTSNRLEVALSACGFLLFFYMGYVIFYVLVYRSVSLRVNVELFRRSNKSFTLSEMQGFYGTSEAFSSRLAAMERNRYFRREGTRLVLTTKGKVVGYGALFLKRFLCLGMGG